MKKIISMEYIDLKPSLDIPVYVLQLSFNM